MIDIPRIKFRAYQEIERKAIIKEILKKHSQIAVHPFFSLMFHFRVSINGNSL